MLKCKFIKFLLNFLTKSVVIPEKIIKKIKLQNKHSFIYILPLYSKTSLCILRKKCKKYYLSDPCTTVNINGIILKRCIFIYRRIKTYPYIILNENAIHLFNSYLKLKKKNPKNNIKILLSFILLGRKPKKDIFDKKNYFTILHFLKKIFYILSFGRNIFIHFSPIISLNDIEEKYINNLKKITVLARCTGIYFIRQYYISVGPYFPMRHKHSYFLSKSKVINTAIKDNARTKKISYKKSKKNTYLIIKEISANFSYSFVRITDYIMYWLWKKLYQSININGIQNVFEVLKRGNRVIYLPCHRSHMDYLLLSYVLYHQGITPPHIAAGINLNFFPAGIIFRHLGAFFIRRSFRVNKLYTTIFREYLKFLFRSGYSIEYFIEGSRSRTGRLLDPKTGILSMTIQAILKSNLYRPVTIVPVYIGYEHVIEVTTYAKELSGQRKKKEGIFSVIKSLKSLHNFGKSYINFGKPLPLIHYIKKYVPECFLDFSCTETVSKPVWFNIIVNKISTEVMVRINNATAVNAVNLSSLILLNTNNFVLTINRFYQVLDFYLTFLRNVPYSLECTMPNVNAEKILALAVKMKKLKIKQTFTGDTIITISKEQKILMSYYRNNIHHMFIFPSLVIAFIKKNQNITKKKLLKKIIIVYPMLKNEFFLRWNKNEIPMLLEKVIDEFLKQDLLKMNQNQLSCNNVNKKIINMIYMNIFDTIHRYIITFFILIQDPKRPYTLLITDSMKISKGLVSFKGLEYYDKSVFKTLITTLRKENYIINTENVDCQKINTTYKILINLVDTKTRTKTENFILKN